MNITKFANGNINLKCNDGEKSYYGIASSDDLMWADLSLFVSSCDGWMYLYDSNKDLLYSINDYGYDNITDLIRGDMVKLTPLKLDDEAREIVNDQYN